MESKYDIISIGDTTLDVFLEVDLADAKGRCELDNEKCLVCFPYGSKVPVKKMASVPAVGNAANNAIGSSRLGLKTAIYTVIGSDRDSEDHKKVFEDEGVDTQFVVMEKDARSNFSTVINYGAERTIFVYHEDRKYDLPELPPSKWVYYTSVAKGHDILHKQVPEYIKKSGAKLGFNPGSYQLLEGIEVLKPILEVTDVLLLNSEEAHRLVGGDPSAGSGQAEDIKGLIRELRKYGTKTVVITDGRSGSFASFDGREFWHVGVPQDSPVVERTGAGDAYSTGFLAAQIMDKDLPECMIWGTMNSTSVVQYIGAREGLLTQEGISKFIEKYGGEVRPKII